MVTLGTTTSTVHLLAYRALNAAKVTPGERTRTALATRMLTAATATDLQLTRIASASAATAAAQATPG